MALSTPSNPRRGVPEMATRLLRRVTGRFYLAAVSATLVACAAVVAIGGGAANTLFVQAPFSRDVIVVAIALAFYLTEAVSSNIIVLRRAPELRAWLRGAPASAEAARAQGLALPGWTVRRGPVYYAVMVVSFALFDAFAMLLFELPLVTGFLMFPGSLLVFAYWMALRFLVLEAHLRPLLEELSALLTTGPASAPPPVSVRRRLLIVLPAINVVSGVLAVGVAAGDDAALNDLAIAIAASAAIALTVSFWLTALLADSIAAPLVDLLRATRKVAAGDLGARVPITSTNEAGELSAAFNEMVSGLEERERLRHAFGTFVDPSLTDVVMREGTDMAGESVDLTVMFLDVRGFTAFAEQAHAHSVVARLNELFEAVVPIVLAHGGHLNKFVGDGLLAVFGAPDRRDDHADRAVAAARVIAARVEAQFGERLQVGIGINSGTAVAGTVGGGGRLEFAVIGDTVNIAARTEAATRDTDDAVLLTEATRERMRDGGRGCEARGEVAMKGRRDPVALFTVSI